MRFPVHLQALKENVTKRIENKSVQGSPALTMMTPPQDSVMLVNQSPLYFSKREISPLKTEYTSSFSRKNESDNVKVKRKVSFQKDLKSPSTSLANSFVFPIRSKNEEKFIAENMLLPNMTIETEENERGSILKTMHDNYKKQLQQRFVQKERLVNASVLVTKKEEEFREKLREDYLEREKKWLEKKKRLFPIKKDLHVK